MWGSSKPCLYKVQTSWKVVLGYSRGLELLARRVLVCRKTDEYEENVPSECVISVVVCVECVRFVVVREVRSHCRTVSHPSREVLGRVIADLATEGQSMTRVSAGRCSMTYGCDRLYILRGMERYRVSGKSGMANVPTAVVTVPLYLTLSTHPVSRTKVRS